MGSRTMRTAQGTGPPPLPSWQQRSGFDVTEREVPGMFGAAAAIRPRRRALSVHALRYTGFRDGVSAS
ncbi:hypothetical protein LA080_001187 [Diaporthe eres]|nr:hypothetical protein LA080_001187 [Diaporthe eres]